MKYTCHNVLIKHCNKKVLIITTTVSDIALVYPIQRAPVLYATTPVFDVYVLY